MGERMLVSMATSVIETSVWAQWKSGIEMPESLWLWNDTAHSEIIPHLYREREEGEVSERTKLCSEAHAVT